MPRLPHAAAAVVVLLAACSSDDPQAGGGPEADRGEPVVLFVQAAPGTVGLDSPDDLHRSAIDDDEHDQGFASLAALLGDDGFDVRSVDEGPDGADLTGALDDVDVLVLGSNNATYDDADVEAVTTFVRDGGGLLVFSDSNYGSTHDAAPESDNRFLAPFDLRLARDAGGVPTDTVVADAAPDTGDHPILEGVEVFRWYGPTAIEVTDDNTRVGPEVLVAATAEVAVAREGDQIDTRPPTERDAEIAIVEYGAGRVVAILDRDLFFNAGQASLDTADNARLATNVFEWLSGQR